jgi:hypothetical protein
MDGLKKHDYEPAAIKEDQNHRIVLSRFHWKLITMWTDLILLEAKPKISFVSQWHTPVAHCTDFTMHLGIPEVNDAITNIKRKIRARAYFLLFRQQVRGPANIENQFAGLPISYSDVLTAEAVPKRYTYSFDEMVGMAIIGSLNKLPSETEEEIRKMSIRFSSNEA